MFDNSRTDIYDYLYNLMKGVVTDNVYLMTEPQELTQSDLDDGFIVIHVGELIDRGEFQGECFGRARCYVEAFIPPISRGRIDIEKYRAYEEGIMTIINEAIESESEPYCIQAQGVISSDFGESGNAKNNFFTFVKSFLVITDNREN